MNLPYFDLSAKTALVSGGATGIGLGIATGLAEAGAQVAICSRRLDTCRQVAEELQEQTGASVFALELDVTSREQCEHTVKQIEERCGAIDILVNCAGISGGEKLLTDMTDPDWDQVININLKGVYTLTQAAVPGMIQRGKGGRVINIASIGAKVGWPSMSSYCASKGGVVQLTKVMALEWARYGIMVNAILPGYFDTPINQHFFATETGQTFIKRNIPLRRLGHIDEIKGVAILLASQAGSFMTGSEVVVDGGHISH